MRQAALRTVLLAAAFAATATPAAHATFTSDLSGGNITMTGNGASDIVRIQRSGALLAHDRASAGDPGFASDTDWDTGSIGTQSLNASQTALVSVNGGPSSDVIVLGGTGGSASALVQDFVVDGGGGLDALIIDSSLDNVLIGRTGTFNGALGSGTVAITGNSATGDFEYSDTDVVQMRFGDGPDTAAVNTSDAGTGLAIEGNGGNDTVNVGGGSLLGIAGMVQFDGDSATNDHLNVSDAGTGFGGTYLVTPESTKRSGYGDIDSDTTVERVTLTTTAHADSIFKSGPRAVTVNAGGGDDLISARDSIGDTANCGAGSDFVLSDALDTLTDCEASDRTLATPPPSGGGDPGTGTGTGAGDTTTTTPMMPAEMQDNTAPTAAISGLKSSVRLKALLKGIKPMVMADERASYEVQLLGAPRSAQLARTYNLTLARRNLPLEIGVRTATLKPNKRLIGRARKFTVRVAVTPTDAAGNRGKTVTKTVKVRR